MTSAGRMVVGPHDGGVDRDHPPVLVDIATSLQRGQDAGPGAVRGPTAVSVVDRLPTAVRLRQVPPRRPGPSPPQHPVHDLAVVLPRTGPTTTQIREKGLEECPLLVSQVMSIMHRSYLSDPTRNHLRDTP